MNEVESFIKDLADVLEKYDAYISADTSGNVGAAVHCCDREREESISFDQSIINAKYVREMLTDRNAKLRAEQPR